MRKFKTESKKLLDLMINSIYTNKEIFLRELISNASDAVDKLNFKSLQDPSVKLDQGDLAIRVSFDKAARTITISDNGIGMTAEELERSFKTGYAEDGEMTYTCTMCGEMCAMRTVNQIMDGLTVDLGKE